MLGGWVSLMEISIRVNISSKSVLSEHHCRSLMYVCFI